MCWGDVGCGWCVCCVAHTWLGARGLGARDMADCGAVDGSGWMVVKVDGVMMLIVWLGDEHGG